MQVSRIISVDLPWSGGKEKRTVAAAFDGVAPHLATDLPSSPDELVEQIACMAAPSALVLMDIPIEGCEHLSSTDAFRALDRRLLRVGVPILPSVKAGGRGAKLKRLLRARRSDLRIEESYPYAVLRVLWALQRQEKVAALFDDCPQGADLEFEWGAWPPKYKRARIIEARRKAMREIADLLRKLWDGRAGDLVRSPDGVGGLELDRICDEYDALLGLVAGWALDQSSAWSWRAEVQGEPGSIVTVGDGWLRGQFEMVQKRG